jgi:hypothetical protein
MATAEFIHSRDFYLEVRKGNIPFHSIVHKFGAAQAITTVLTPVSTSKLYPTPSVLTNLEIVSTSANDTAAGSGALTLRISGISDVNGSWTEQEIDIALNGLTPVALPNGMWRVFRMHVLSSGTYANSTAGSHNSTITLRVAGAGATWHVINTEAGFGLGQTEIGVYTIPAGKTGYILNKHITTESTKSATVVLFTRESANVVVAPFGAMNLKEIERNLTGNITLNNNVPILVVPEMSDVGFMAKSITSTTNVSVHFEILLIDN